ncbi:MAG: DUF3943 domain-containing protein [Muribaculaceae bacterium]|nr:DUF3943 domain-containing protein [Muribaculaceae bacterium]
MRNFHRTNLRDKLKFALLIFLTGVALTALALPAVAEETDSIPSATLTIAEDDLIIKSEPTTITVFDEGEEELSVAPPTAPVLNNNPMAVDTLFMISGRPQSIYSRPASWTFSDPWWHGMWINTAVYAGAFVGTLFVLECLPEDATAWNRAELRQAPFYKRWFDNIFKKGPEWDHDKFVFNFVLHPYAGAAYFMAARTCGFNFWQSMLYSACISTIGWEFGIEACMERPSYQDLFITPVVGSLMGEGFYRLKRLIVDRNYEILGTPVIGHICAFFLDPVNEVVGLLSPPSECRTIGPGCLHSQPLLIPSPANAGGGAAIGFSISATF